MDKLYTYDEVLAYADGYFHGRSEGVLDNTYRTDTLRIQYDAGYTAGVRDFITFDEGSA